MTGSSAYGKDRMARRLLKEMHIRIDSLHCLPVCVLMKVCLFLSFSTCGVRVACVDRWQSPKDQ